MCKLTWLTTSVENSTVIVWFPMENSVSPLVQVNDNAQKKLQFASLLTDYEANFLTTSIEFCIILDAGAVLMIPKIQIQFAWKMLKDGLRDQRHSITSGNMRLVLERQGLPKVVQVKV
ncbi:hypothetical protein NC652_017363 [Populus alba x Populus x berolinensis]|nr:hypothetical protein NC652_017363 [Populus alba x Populus x berolinensis]